MPSKVMKIGIMSKENYKQRTIAIARGEYKPRKNEPKVWFESMDGIPWPGLEWSKSKTAEINQGLAAGISG